MARAIDQPAKESYSLVEFIVEGTPYRFTNWGTTLEPAGDNWLSIPAMDIKWPNNVGTLNDSGATIKVQEDASATMQSLVNLLLDSGAPAPEVRVTIREIIRSPEAGIETSTLTPFKGHVVRAVRHSGGKSGQVKFEILSAKGRLDVKLGLPCSHHCIWSLFGKGCSVQGGAGQRGPQLATERRTGIGVSAISNKSIQLGSDPGIAANKSLQFGYVERDGVRVGIQNWDRLDPTVLVLRQQPPASWVGSQVTVVPGCAKTKDACDSDWSNLDNFGGIGYAIPAYNPNFEDKP